MIGYTGEISESELDIPEYAKYNQGQIIGKTGIEKQYNDTLMGIDGERQSVVDNRGKEREVLGIKEAKPGKNLQLTIDLDLQVVAELALEGKRGAVVALDPAKGRDTGDGVAAEFRSEQVCCANQVGGLEGTDERSGQSAAQSRDTGAVGAGFHVQADHRAGWSGDGRDRRKHDFQLPGRRELLRAFL